MIKKMIAGKTKYASNPAALSESPPAVLGDCAGAAAAPPPVDCVDDLPQAGQTAAPSATCAPHDEQKLAIPSLQGDLLSNYLTELHTERAFNCAAR
jgi:hypothetical protein